MNYSFTIRPDNNENYVKMAFDAYNNFNDAQSLINLITTSLAYELCYTNIGEMGIKIGKYRGKAYFEQDTIFLNERLLENMCKSSFIDLFVCIFHELSHAMVYKLNSKIFSTKQGAKNFLPVYNYDYMYEIFYSITKDKIFSNNANFYLYLKNKNEVFARKNSYKICANFFSEFAPQLVKDIPNFEEHENYLIENLYKKYPYIAGKEEHLIKLIEQFQLNLISKGLNNLTEKDKAMLISSLVVTFSQKTRDLLVNECIKSKSKQILTCYLSNPLFCPTKEEFIKLSQVYSEKQLKTLTYTQETIAEIK